jgi:hypothetical protein
MNLPSATGTTSNLQAIPSSNRQLITVESANQSTNLPAVRVKPLDRHHLIGGSDARAIVGADQAPLLRLWRGKRRDVELKDLSSCRCYEANSGQGPVGLELGALFYAIAVFFLGWLQKNILLILLRFLSGNKRLRFGALDKVSSNQLVQSRPQERLK